MRELIAIGLLIAGAWWVGCSRDECDDRDVFGQKVERSDDAQSKCDAANQSSNPVDNSGGSSSGGTGGSGGGNTGGGSGGGTTGGGGESGPDAIAPTVVGFARDSTQQPQTSDLPIVFRVQFSEVINPVTFTAIDIINLGTATGVTYKITDSGDSKSFNISIMNASFGTLRPRIVVGSLSDLAGNLNTTNFDSSDSVDFVSGPLRITINQAESQPDPANLPPIYFRVDFSRPISPVTFSSADIVNQGTATGFSTLQFVKQDDLTWYISTGGSAGTFIPFIAAGSIQDTNGIQNLDSTSIDGKVTYEPGL